MVSQSRSGFFWELRNPEDFRLEVQKVDEGQLGSVMYHFGYKAGWMVSWFCVRNPGQKGAPHKYPGQVSGSSHPCPEAIFFLRSGTNLGKFDCQMGFALETGQEMGFFCLFRLGHRIVGTGGLNRHGRMSMLRVAGFGQFANPGWSGWSLQAGGRKVGLVGCCGKAGGRKVFLERLDGWWHFALFLC